MNRINQIIGKIVFLCVQWEMVSGDTAVPDVYETQLRRHLWSSVPCYVCLPKAQLPLFVFSQEAWHHGNEQICIQPVLGSIAVVRLWTSFLILFGLRFLIYRMADYDRANPIMLRHCMWSAL